MNAIITGATRGIGKAIAGKLAMEGFNLAICSRNKEELEAVSEEFSAADGVKVHYMQTDCGKKQDVLKFADFAAKHLGTIDLLVNNAAIYKDSGIIHHEEGSLEEMMEANLYGPYYLSKNIAQKMIEQKHGHIFNIASVAGINAYPQASNYGITKFALMGLTKNLREELKPHKIKVTAVIPGSTLTSSWGDTPIPASQFVSPNDIASAIYTIYNMSEGACVEEITIKPV